MLGCNKDYFKLDRKAQVKIKKLKENEKYYQNDLFIWIIVQKFQLNVFIFEEQVILHSLQLSLRQI